jgi:hypothetical protein
MVVLQFFRYSQRKVQIICDEDDISPADYTCVVKKIENDTPGVDYDDELRQIIEKEVLPDGKTKVVKVNLCFDLTE